MQLKIKIYASKNCFMHLKFILCNYIYLKIFKILIRILLFLLILLKSNIFRHYLIVQCKPNNIFIEMNLKL